VCKCTAEDLIWIFHEFQSATKVILGVFAEQSDGVSFFILA